MQCRFFAVIPEFAARGVSTIEERPMMPVANDPIPVTAEPTRIGRPRRVEVVVVSGNDEFLIEVGPLLGDGFRTRPVDSPNSIAAAAAEQSQSGDAPPSVILLDAVSLSDARSAVVRIETAHPHMPIIVVAPSRDESYWGAALARGAIIDVVARDDLAGDRFKQALNRAATRARTAPAAPPPGEVSPAAKNNSKLLIGAAIAVAIGLGGFFALHKSAPAPALGNTSASAKVSGSVAAGAAPESGPQSVLELLSAARIAFRDQKLLPRTDAEPRGDSAMELYAQALAQDPKNDEAIDGMQRLFTVVKTRVQADLATNKLDDAVRLVASFKATNLDSDGVRELDASITAARPKYYAARAQELIAANDFSAAEQLIQQLSPLDRTAASELRHAMESRKAEQQTVAQLTSLAGSVKAAIDAGNLIEAPNDNARTRLQSMRQISRNHPITLAAQRDLQNALINRAQELASKEQFDPASKLLIAAGDIAATPEVADAKRQLQSDIDQVNQRAALAAAAKKVAEAALSNSNAEGNTDGAAAAVAASYIAAKPTQPLKVIYPSAAAERSVQGYVVVEFMLQPDGRAAQPTIAEANPQRIFDAAAIDAVMSGRYDTSRLVNKAPRRARVRLSFRPS
jgi:TonB family protein